jgi:hypothetical protein
MHLPYTSQALQNLRPGALWEIRNENYNTLIWNDTEQTKPSQQEVEAEARRLQAEFDSKEYQRQRAPNYPPIGDQLDALWKGGDAAAEMLARVQAVKAQFPKPEEA